MKLSAVFHAIAQWLIDHKQSIYSAAQDVEDWWGAGHVLAAPIWWLYDLLCQLQYAFVGAETAMIAVEDTVAGLIAAVNMLLIFDAEHYLGIWVHPGETLWHKIVREVLRYMNIEVEWDGDLWDSFWGAIEDAITENILPHLPSSESILYVLYGWWDVVWEPGDSWFEPIWRKINTLMGIVILTGETWWEALTRTINETILPQILSLIPSFDDIHTKLLEWFEIVVGEGESLHNALIRMVTEALPTWEQIWQSITDSTPEIAGLLSWWHDFTDPVQQFFSDPLGSMLDWFAGIVEDHQDRLLLINDKIGEALFKPHEE